MLPKNEPKKFIRTPKNFFIYGKSMSGKTHLACQFPNPLLLNTDGNAVKVATPSIHINDYTQFTQVINEIEKGGHTYESIIIDLIDDLKSLIEMSITKRANVKTILDLGFGKGTTEFKNTWKEMITRIANLKYNVIFISHVIETAENFERPSLDQKELNVAMGRCDVGIKCEQTNFGYYRKCERKRENYTVDDIPDKQFLQVLSTIQNLIKK